MFLLPSTPLLTVLPKTVALADLPPVPREFRGVWVATVDNIDWPSSRTLSAATQRAELIKILDKAVALNLNAVLLQVRPAADALYNSSLEPWSEYLTGRQGQAPDPAYDPLAFAVEEAHKRGLELHAWFNPYRAKHPSATGPLAYNHVAVAHPSSVRKFGTLLWMDPGDPYVQKHSLEVIEDVVRRYDIDGIHLDDYFYPYPEKGATAFNDSATYQKYGHGLSKLEWRRQNVNRFIQSVYQGVHAIKPWIEMGISPFGIYRPGVPAGIVAGIDQYQTLASDPVKWLQQGWCDYLAPQLYWPIDQKPQSFTTLLSWWASQNSLGRHLWPGLYTSKAMAKPTWTQEITNQVSQVRTLTNDQGEIHFSMKPFLLDSNGIDDVLKQQVYQDQALPPASPWLGADAPNAPQLSFGPDGAATWHVDGPVPADRYIVWENYGGRWQEQILPGSTTSVNFARQTAGGPLTAVAIAAASRTGAISQAAVAGSS